MISAPSKPISGQTPSTSRAFAHRDDTASTSPSAARWCCPSAPAWLGSWRCSRIVRAASSFWLVWPYSPRRAAPGALMRAVRTSDAGQLEIPRTCFRQGLSRPRAATSVARRWTLPLSAHPASDRDRCSRSPAALERIALQRWASPVRQSFGTVPRRMPADAGWWALQQGDHVAGNFELLFNRRASTVPISWSADCCTRPLIATIAAGQ